MQVEQVDFVTVPTRDTARAVAFYRDVLGLPQSEFSSGEVEAPNVAAARAELEAKGVEFIGDTYDSKVCHMGFFKDPDGNTVSLHRRYAPRNPR